MSKTDMKWRLAVSSKWSVYVCLGRQQQTVTTTTAHGHATPGEVAQQQILDYNIVASGMCRVSNQTFEWTE